MIAARNLSGLAAQLRRDTEEEALREALLVPWRRLLESSETYIEWRTFVLWVRAITETAARVPDTIRSELELRCHGFLSTGPSPFDWRALAEWICSRHFDEAQRGGWFTALMYYAHSDLRTEQSWVLWERSNAEWSRNCPARWPKYDEWKAQATAIHKLEAVSTEKARAAEAMANVDSNRLQEAVADLLESRAFAVWADCISRSGNGVSEFLMDELRRHYPGLLTSACPTLMWGMPLLLRLVRHGGDRWRAAARQEGWMPLLRYQVVHHPRYRRLIHYRESCRDAWSLTRPISYPPFADWLVAADAYYVKDLR